MSIVWRRLIQHSFQQRSQTLCNRSPVTSITLVKAKSIARLTLIALTSASVYALLAQSAIARPNRINLPKTTLPKTTLPKITLPKTTLEIHHGKAPSTPLRTKTHAKARSKARSIRFRLSTPPPDRGTPRAPHGTGSRGDCLQPADLPPLSQLAGSPGLDLTISEHPQFWVYVPYAQADVATAKFSLQTGDTEVYQQAVQLPDTPGILAIALPTTLPPLEVGTAYRWYFELTCPQSDPTAEPTPAAVTGSVQRVAPSATLLNQLDIAQSPLDTVEAYAENYIWYETLSQLAQLRLQNPNDQSLTEIWQTLLSDPDVGLGTWADVPILGDNTPATNLQPVSD